MIDIQMYLHDSTLRDAILSMRNPMNSWNNSDSEHKTYFTVGQKDLELAERLVKAGTDHGKFMRMITVTTHITAPLYWWKEFDTYKIGTVTNSCSTMHKIHSKEFTLEDFSTEHMQNTNINLMKVIIEVLNAYRKCFIKTEEKVYWWNMIQLLPSSYNQKRTVMLNYEVLRNIYHSRKNHKLDEWQLFCDEIEKLPYSKLITEK